MKNKIVICVIVLAFVAAVIAAVLIIKGQNCEKAELWTNGEQVKVRYVKDEEEEIYVSAEDLFKGVKLEYEESDKAAFVKGKKFLKIDKERETIAINGEKTQEKYLFKDSSVMIPISVAEEIIGGESVVINGKPWVFKTEVIDVNGELEGGSIDFGYSDDFFRISSKEYNHPLAKISLLAAASAFSSQGNESWGEEGTVGRENNISDFLEEIGMENVKFFNYDKALSDTEDKVAFAIGEKEIGKGKGKQKLVMVAVRGGNYGGEWASNLKLGSENNHLGFESAANEVKREIENYIKDGDNVKLWITGYSRGAAVANIVAANMRECDKVLKDGIYAYTFATPKGVTDKERNNDKYGYIFNIINDNDLVPNIAPQDWGFGRYGKDVKFPALASYDEKAAERINNKTAEIYSNLCEGKTLDVLMMENENQGEYVSKGVKNLSAAIGSRKDYCDGIQKIMVEFVGCCNFKVQNDDGTWRRATALETLDAFYGEDGKAAQESIQNDKVFSKIAGMMGSSGDRIQLFGAVCQINGKNPAEVIVNQIGLSNLDIITSLLMPFSDTTERISRAHEVQCYAAMLFATENPKDLIIN